jgi:hypothetical protein
MKCFNRMSIKCAAVTVLCGLGLTPAVARAGTPATVGSVAPDPDAMRGLDDPNWFPPPGTIRIATLPSGLGALPANATGLVAAQEASGDGFSWKGTTTTFFTYCVSPSPEDAKSVDMRGCFRVRRFDSERDVGGNEYFGEGFNVFAAGKNGWKLQRVKGRSEQRNGQSVDWAPGADESRGDPTQITVSAGWNGSGMQAAWNVYPGRVHPWVNPTVFHSSWIANGGGAGSGKAVQAVGAAVWKFGPNATVDGGSGIAEAWLRK